jgi:hypothetical protein
VKPESAAAVIDIASSAFVTLDEGGRVREWTSRAAELFG